MVSQLARIGFAAALLFVTATAFGQTPTHIYELNNSFADTLGGPALDNTPGATFQSSGGATGLQFGAGQGPSLSNGIDADDYSIEMYFRIDTTTGFRKIVDFKNLTSDTGLYNLSTALNFFNVATGPANVFADNTLAHVVITRDGITDAFVGYVNGIQQISFNDSSDLAVFSGTNNIAHFLRDDNAVGGEQSAGFLDFIRIYDAPLTQGQVTDRFNIVTSAVTVPEASPLALIGAVLPVIGFVVSRRRRAE